MTGFIAMAIILAGVIGIMYVLNDHPTQPYSGSAFMADYYS
jgi:hypothetical protein